MADNGLEGAVLGVSWDGSGYGLDGTVWGGEFLRATAAGFERAAHLRTFALPGGDRAVREPRRSALGALHEIYGDELWGMRELAPLAAFTAEERRVLAAMLARGAPGAPRTSSAGRLFDAAASRAGLRHFSAFEGQAAMELEFAAEEVAGEMGDGDEIEAYPFRVSPGTAAAAAAEEPGPASAPLVVDWEPILRALVEDVRRGEATGRVAARFHAGLAEAMVSVARAVGERRVVLTGGCFQNRLLLEMAVGRLRAAGFEPYWHREAPPNDGGLALGQAVAAAHRIERTRSIQRAGGGERAGAAEEEA
jgi:hydrogenase maturation protein HypF